jgi:catechol 2,3-dioxygenase-like lactoylglutathione lyase family enzyme
MKVKSLGWMGVKTKNAATMTAFYRDVLQLEDIGSNPHDAGFRLEDGTEVHVYPDTDDFHSFFGVGPVVGLVVDSFAQAHAALEQAGIEWIYPEPQRANGKIWQHFRAPDDNVYEIIAEDEVE